MEDKKEEIMKETEEKMAEQPEETSPKAENLGESQEDTPGVAEDQGQANDTEKAAESEKVEEPTEEPAVEEPVIEEANTEAPEENQDVDDEAAAADDSDTLTPIDTALEEDVTEEERSQHLNPEDYGSTIDLNGDLDDEDDDDDDSQPKVVGTTFDGPKKKAKIASKDKGKKNGLIITGVILGILLAIYLGGAYFYTAHFFPNTNMNGYDASNKTVADTEAMIKQNEADYVLTLTERGGATETITATAIDLKYLEDGKLETLLGEQVPWQWPAKLFGGENANMQEAFTYNQDKLSAVIAALKVVSNPSVTKAANAYPVYKDKAVTVVPEVKGNEVDVDAFTKAVQKAIATGTTTLDMDGGGCYVTPLTADSKEVLAAKQTMEKYCKAVITYTFGDAKEVVDAATIGSWLVMDDAMKVSVDEDKVAQYLSDLADKYDTVGSAHNFTTSGGSQITVSGGNYGWSINEVEERAEILTILEAGQPVTREPVYVSTALSRDPSNDIGNTYVEISLSAQTMWLYVNGSLVVSTPVVTGCVADGHGTPSGVYSIAYKAEGVTLKGDGYASFVNYWMPFDTSTGNGIHDADGWRGSYGGDIYYSGGSHGCVNTPYSATSTIYNNISDGDPVVVY